MPTLRLAPGEWGKIRTYRRESGKWMAVAQYCDETGRVAQRSKTARSEAAAIRALKEGLTEKQLAEGGPSIDGKTRVRAVAEVMFEEKQADLDAGQLSPGTMRNYRDYWARYIEPAMGELALAWVTVQRTDRFLKDLRKRKGAATVRGVRSLLAEILDVAVRYDALASNPVGKTADIPGEGPRTVKALDAAEAVHVWRRLSELATTRRPEAVNNRRYSAMMCDPMVPDLWLWMLGTGDRISNALAARWPWIDMDVGTARLGPNVIRVPGEGLRINEGNSKSRVVEDVDLPSQVIAMLLARQQCEDHDPMGLVFPDAFGGLLDPSNVSSKKLRPALVAIGYGHISSHWCRRTLGTELDAAGMSLTAIAGRLRHADSRTTEKHYIRKRGGNPRVRAAIEAMLSVEPERRVVPIERPG